MDCVSGCQRATRTRDRRRATRVSTTFAAEASLCHWRLETDGPSTARTKRTELSCSARWRYHRMFHCFLFEPDASPGDCLLAPNHPPSWLYLYLTDPRNSRRSNLKHLHRFPRMDIVGISLRGACGLALSIWRCVWRFPGVVTVTRGRVDVVEECEGGCFALVVVLLHNTEARVFRGRPMRCSSSRVSISGASFRRRGPSSATECLATS